MRFDMHTTYAHEHWQSQAHSHTVRARDGRIVGRYYRQTRSTRRWSGGQEKRTKKTSKLDLLSCTVDQKLRLHQVHSSTMSVSIDVQRQSVASR
jgi:hypothetical protein